jgi:rhodanese-related sulfurtransferase
MRPRRRLAATVLSAVALVAAGVAVGLLANTVASGGIPLVREAGSPGATVSLLAARAAYPGGATFVDARPHAEYESGHVDGAISVPVEARARELDRLRRELPRTSPLIVYCAGGDCGSADELSAWLLGEGWRDVRVLEGGLPAWEAAGFPVRGGDSP